MPESRGRKKDVYTPPPAKTDRTPVRLGSGRWVAPTMVTLFVVGLLWIVVFYIAPDNALQSHFNAFVNVLIGFVFIGAGFVVSTRWK
ncbi:MAG: cell division protein CrgA [Candidatus Nanopelagicales bacterium]